jgi:hypothetical protein
LCLVLGLTVRQFIPVHSGDECYLIPDVLFPWVALPLILSFAALLWSAVLEANMKERTPPATKPLRSSRGRKIPTVIAGKPFQGNSFHSDHWGKGI